MDAETSTEQQANLPAANPQSAAGPAPMIPPPQSAGESAAADAPAAGSSLTGQPQINSLLKGAQLGKKTEAFTIGAAGLTSNMTRAAADKLINAVVPAIAKKVMRALIAKPK